MSESPEHRKFRLRRNHACVARGCVVQVGRAKLFCAEHWKLVPYGLKQKIARSWNPGQERHEAEPSDAFFQLVLEAAAEISRIEEELSGPG